MYFDVQIKYLDGDAEKVCISVHEIVGKITPSWFLISDQFMKLQFTFNKVESC